MELLIGKKEKTLEKVTKPVSNSSIKERLGHVRSLVVMSGHVRSGDIRVNTPWKGEWERYKCDKDKAIICDVGIDCDSVSGGTIIVGGHNCQGQGIIRTLTTDPERPCSVC